MAKVTGTFSLDSERDRDILRWLDACGNKSDAIRRAIRASIGGGVTLGDLHQGISEIKRLLESGAIVQSRQTQGGAPVQDNPLVAAAERALADLGL